MKKLAFRVSFKTLIPELLLKIFHQLKGLKKTINRLFNNYRTYVNLGICTNLRDI